MSYACLKNNVGTHIPLKPILQTIILCGRQNIPLRGHRDDREFQQETSINEGNFRELLRYRIRGGDEILQQHLQQARATYISKTTQNQLIDCCGEAIRSHIIRDVKDAVIYSIMFDETTDVSHISQMTLVIRYISGNNDVKESFLQFIDLYNEITDADDANKECVEPKLTGAMLGNIVIKALKNFNLDLKNCVGIGTDTCSVMVSEVRGAVMNVMREAEHCVYVPCHNHVLNLAIAQSSKVQAVRNAVGIMKATIAFFTASAKR